MFSFTCIIESKNIANSNTYSTVSQLCYEHGLINQTHQSVPKQTPFSNQLVTMFLNIITNSNTQNKHSIDISLYLKIMRFYFYSFQKTVSVPIYFKEKSFPLTRDAISQFGSVIFSTHVSKIIQDLLLVN